MRREPVKHNTEIEIKKWLTKARICLDAAILLSLASDFVLTIACFAAHQSIENSLKALIRKRTTDIPAIHNLVKICKEHLEGGSNADILRFIDMYKKLESFEEATRYPNLKNKKNEDCRFSVNDLELSIKTAEDTLTLTEKRLFPGENRSSLFYDADLKDNITAAALRIIRQGRAPSLSSMHIRTWEAQIERCILVTECIKNCIADPARFGLSPADVASWLRRTSIPKEYILSGDYDRENEEYAASARSGSINDTAHIVRTVLRSRLPSHPASADWLRPFAGGLAG